MTTSSFWRGTDVFLTGHTGFKGAWLTLWLQQLGARVTGYALSPPTTPSLFDLAGVADAVVASHDADIRDLETVRSAMAAARPRIVFHLAAQPLVRASYNAPCDTIAVNVMGTAHVLEAARHLDSIEAVVIVTTDKCYDNLDWVYPYRENDRLGGKDPYSASKAAAELVADSYRRSFCSLAGTMNIATARAGNVIGGGDWAEDRLVSDCIRAFQRNEPIVLRNPNSIRPWQHVLDPLAGYLRLGEALCGRDGKAVAEGWNFGPAPGDEADVLTIARTAAQAWGKGAVVTIGTPDANRAESSVLRLDSTKARTALGWSPVWPFARSLTETMAWYRHWRDGSDIRAITLAQINAFEADAMTARGSGRVGSTNDAAAIA